MDADRVRAYLQVACAGLGFDIGEVWWMSNESGTSTVAAIEDREARGGTIYSATSVGNEIMPLSIPSSTAAATTTTTIRTAPKKRFLQLYTSKAYNDQRSKLVQPRADNSSVDDDGNASVSYSLDDNDDGHGDCNTTTNLGASSLPAHTTTTLRRTNSDHSLELEREHVLSPRIVEAVTHSTQVVWANCQRSEGLLGRSDVRLQTAVGMPVGVDECGNVWVVVMFSPMNVESSNDAIDYLKYISRSAATTGIPCLLPVWGGAEMMTTTPNVSGGAARRRGETKFICNGNDDSDAEDEEDEVDTHNIHHRSLVSITPRPNLSDHTEELGEGVIAKFVSFNVNDDDEEEEEEEENDYVNDHPGGMIRIEKEIKSTFETDVRFSPSPSPTPTAYSNNFRDVIDDAITDAFDEASYGVWSTIMNSSGMTTTSSPMIESCRGNNIDTSMSTASSVAILRNISATNTSTQLELIQGRLEEFATAFLGMSVFDVADVWTVVSSSNGDNSLQHDYGNENVVTNHPIHLECLFTVAATNTNPEINALRNVSMNTSIDIADGAVGRAYNSGCPVWSSIKEIVYDSSRRQALENCKIETGFAVPIATSEGVPPSCILCFYSLLPADSVPFVMKFVQKAVQLLWSGLDVVENPHESVGKELWKDVGPADLGEMAADVEMQKAFVGKKRPRGFSFLGDDRVSSLSTQRNSNSVLRPNVGFDTVSAPPPNKGLAPAPILPRMVQECSPNALQFIYFDSATEGHWAVQQAVQSIRDVQLWHGTSNDNGVHRQLENQPTTEHHQHQQERNLLLHPPPQQQHQTHTAQQFQPPQYHMSHVNYNNATAQHQQEPRNTSVACPPAGVHTDDPALIHANLIEFNAMAQMHAHNNRSHNISQITPTPAPATNGKVGVPIIFNNSGAIPNRVFSASYGESSMYHAPRIAYATNDNINVQLTINSEFHQTMYCTDAARQPSAQLMDECLYGIEQTGCRMDGCNDLAVPKRPYCARHCDHCRIEGCNDLTVPKRPYCAKHCGNRQCEKEGCNKCAQGATRFCIAHGGGRRCTYPGCDKGARDKHFCAAHGGGKRCKTDGCSKSAVGGSLFCTGHGGGKRCRVPGCDKSAQSSTEFCVKHGGGKKCQHPGCEKVARGRTLFCAAHGGGIRCKVDGCNRVAVGKIQLCRSHGGGADTQGIGQLKAY